MSLLPDDAVISAHDRDAVWKDGKCSVCGSITPQAFVASLVSDGLISGWHYASTTDPKYCDTDAGRFVSSHFNDASDQWLRTWQAKIAECTGVVWYWRGEILTQRSFVQRQLVVRSEPISETALTRINAFLRKI